MKPPTTRRKPTPTGPTGQPLHNWEMTGAEGLFKCQAETVEDAIRVYNHRTNNRGRVWTARQLQPVDKGEVGSDEVQPQQLTVNTGDGIVPQIDNDLNPLPAGRSPADNYEGQDIARLPEDAPVVNVPSSAAAPAPPVMADAGVSAFAPPPPSSNAPPAPAPAATVPPPVQVP